MFVKVIWEAKSLSAGAKENGNIKFPRAESKH